MGVRSVRLEQVSSFADTEWLYESHFAQVRLVGLSLDRAEGITMIFLVGIQLIE